MKTLLLPLMALTLLVSCAKDDPKPNGNNDPGAGQFKVKIDGRQFTADFAVAVRITENGQTAIVITAQTDDMSESISLSLPNSTGTFEFIHPDQNATSDFPTAFYSDLGMANAGVANNGGSLKITQLTTNRVKGSFSFTTDPLQGGPSLNFTNGSFDVNIVN